MKNLSSDAPARVKFTLLTVSSDTEDFQSLRQILDPDNFNLRQARSCREALGILEKECPSVVACDNELPDGSWRDIFAKAHDLDEPPPVIVISRHADERLWAEVLNIGGYDVLAKPLESLEVSRVLHSACLYGARPALQTA